MPESRAIVDVKVSVPLYTCVVCKTTAPAPVGEACEPRLRGRTSVELPAGVLYGNAWARPEGWEAVSVGGDSPLDFCPTHGPQILERLRAVIRAMVGA